MSKIIFMKYLPPPRPKMVPKLKMLRIYWNLAHVIFRISRSRFWCQKLFLVILTICSAKIGPKIKSANNVLKFSTFDISNMPISILIWKMIFIKYLPPVRPKLVPKLNMLRIYWNLAHLIFRISRSRFWWQKLFLLNTYRLFGPNWSPN